MVCSFLFASGFRRFRVCSLFQGFVTLRAEMILFLYVVMNHVRTRFFVLLSKMLKVKFSLYTSQVQACQSQIQQEINLV